LRVFPLSSPDALIEHSSRAAFPKHLAKRHALLLGFEPIDRLTTSKNALLGRGSWTLADPFFSAYVRREISYEALPGLFQPLCITRLRPRAAATPCARYAGSNASLDAPYSTVAERKFKLGAMLDLRPAIIVALDPEQENAARSAMSQLYSDFLANRNQW
jgi:hypothetical protein